MKKLKAGLIGGGFIGGIHTEALRRLGYVEVAAIAEADQVMADSAAERLSIPKAYADYKDLINDSEVDVVHVLTPNKFHFPMAMAAVEAGKHAIEVR